MKKLASILNISVGSVGTIVKTYLNNRPHSARKNYINHLEAKAGPPSPLTLQSRYSLKWYFLFGRHKSDLEGVRFEDNAVILYVQEYVRTQPKNFWEKEIKQLSKRWKKCIEANGEYGEG